MWILPRWPWSEVNVAVAALRRSGRLPRPGCLAGLSDPVHHTVINPAVQLRGTKGAPAHFLKLAAHDEVLVQVRTGQLLCDMLPKVEQGNPAIRIGDFIKPLFVVAIVARMKVEHIFANQNEALNALLHQGFDHVALQVHHIVKEGVIPFTNELDDREPFVVIGKQDFRKQCGAADVVPLGMDEVVVDPLCVVGLAVLPVVKRGTLIVTGDVKIPPIVEGFDVVHDQP